MPLGYMLSKMHLIMPLSLCLRVSLIHFLCVHLLNILFWGQPIYLALLCVLMCSSLSSESWHLFLRR